MSGALSDVLELLIRVYNAVPEFQEKAANAAGSVVAGVVPDVAEDVLGDFLVDAGKALKSAN